MCTYNLIKPEWKEKIFHITGETLASYLTDKRLVSGIYFLKPHTHWKMKNKTMEKWVKGDNMCHNKRTIKRDTQVSRKQKKKMILISKEMLIFNKIW